MEHQPKHILERIAFGTLCMNTKKISVGKFFLWLFDNWRKRFTSTKQRRAAYENRYFHFVIPDFMVVSTNRNQQGEDEEKLYSLFLIVLREPHPTPPPHSLQVPLTAEFFFIIFPIGAG